ncbi:MAG: LCP family protein [Oscillospiraceae bacterium]|nr:LCP family protein [Oscillospiraceae bacterium]
MSHKKLKGNPILLIVILLLVLVFLYSGLRFLESTVFRPQDGTGSEDSKTILRDGVEYFPRQDITVLMMAGIDEDGPVKESNSYNNPGEADMVSLIIFDHTDEEIDIISLNRDTMLTMPVLGLNGREAGTYYGQLALAHTYGKGLEDSCINLRKTVSTFLYGLKIDYYVSMNMDAIGILNDAVGGVTVNVTDDFSTIDPDITMGTVTLRGKQAMTFVRTRQGVGDGMNITRMERQKEYMRGFLTALDAAREAQPDLVIDAYQQVAPYMVTDCTATTISTILERYGDYSLGDVVSPQGENVRGKEFMEFHVDEEALDKLILEYLYAPKK